MQTKEVGVPSTSRGKLPIDAIIAAMEKQRAIQITYETALTSAQERNVRNSLREALRRRGCKLHVKKESDLVYTVWAEPTQK